MAKQRNRYREKLPDLFITRPLLGPENTELEAALDHIERALDGRVSMYPMAELCIELFRLSEVSEFHAQHRDEPVSTARLERALDLPKEIVHPRLSTREDRLFFDRRNRLCLSLDDTDQVVDYYVNTAVRRIEDHFDTTIVSDHRGYIPHDFRGDRYGGSVKDYVVVGDVVDYYYPGDHSDFRALLDDPVLYLEMDNVTISLPETVALGAMTVVAHEREHLLPRRIREKRMQYAWT